MSNTKKKGSSIEPSWSPMMCLPRQPLTVSGLLQLDIKDGEVELIRRKNMELRYDTANDNDGIPMTKMKTMSSNKEEVEKWVDRNVNLTITITTHRIVFTNNNCEARFLHHSNIVSRDDGIESTGGGRFVQMKSPKIIVKTTTKGNLLLIFRALSSTQSYASIYDDREDMMNRLIKAIKRRAWEDQTRIQEKKLQEGDSLSSINKKVGVDAILAKNAQRHKEAAKLTNEAFDGDAETLLREATELVKVIEKYVATMEASQKQQKGSGATSKKDEEDATKLSGMLADMGMTSALESTGKKDDEYYVIVARQITDFIKPHLSKNGGLMTLTDVYCYFNRARGTNLISPEDLLKAINFIPTHEDDDNENKNKKKPISSSSLLLPRSIGITTRTYPSGVRVLQDDTYYNDEIIAQKLLDLASSLDSNSEEEEQKEESDLYGFGNGLTVLDVSRSLHISPILANEQLLSAERMGHLCRDVTIETTRFFPNKFQSF